MKIEEQVKKIKENWFILVLMLVLVLFLSRGNMLSGSTSSSYSYQSDYMSAMPTSGFGGVSGFGGGYAESSRIESYYGNNDFAPEIEERIITKNAQISTEIEKGLFQEAELKLKSIIESSEAYLLDESVNRYGYARRSYYRGIYEIKVESPKYEETIVQLKEIGNVQSSSEKQKDITGEYTNLQIEIETEKERLVRYEDMYKEAEIISDKIELNDRIFNQERKIKYMEKWLETKDQQVEYSTIYFTMTEKQSEYASVVFVKFSELVRGLVSSFNALIKLIVVLIPWAIAGMIITFVVKRIKKKK